MNLSLFRSWHLLWAGLVGIGFLVWPFLEDPAISFDWRHEYRFSFLIATGWAAFGAMVVVALYSLRKHMHWLGISPETRNVPNAARLETAGTRLNALRREIRQGRVRERAEILEKARRILREEGIHRAVRVSVVAGTDEALPFEVEVSNREPFGRVSAWLHAHLYYGLAAGALVVFHGGGGVSTPMGLILNLSALVVIVTGIAGVFLFALGPRWLTKLERDLSFEEAYVLDESFRRKLQEATDKLEPNTPLRKSVLGFIGEALGGGPGYRERARTLLEESQGHDDAVRQVVADVTVLAGQCRTVRQDLRGLSRVKFWMNVWRGVHIPAAVLLLGLILIHIMSVYWY